MIAPETFDRIKAEVLAKVESMGGVCKRKQQKMVNQAVRDYERGERMYATGVDPRKRRSKGANQHSDPTYRAAKVDRLVKSDLVQIGGARD